MKSLPMLPDNHNLAYLKHAVFITQVLDKYYIADTTAQFNRFRFMFCCKNCFIIEFKIDREYIFSLTSTL